MKAETWLSQLPDIWKAHLLQIHISKTLSPEEDPKLASEALRIMHRFTPEQVKAKMDEAEKA